MRRCILAFASFVLLEAFLLSASVLAAVDFFPLNELKAGMKGIGKTVVRGTKIETFDVEIIDILPNGGFDGGPLILARFSGPVIELSGGIAAGYSGSPVYINGKLLGAVSSGEPFSDWHIGGITPISSMLSALPRRREIDYSKNTVIPEPKAGPPRFSASPINSEGSKLTEPPKTDEGGIGKRLMVPLYAPLVVNGASPKAVSLLKKALENNPYLKVISDLGSAGAVGKGLLQESTQESPLAPGDAIAVPLIAGDIELSAIGTLTYIDEMGQILAFGHPLLLSGDASYPIGKAYIAYTQKSFEEPFKTGFRLNSLGAITRDRLSAVGGLLGEKADTLPVTLQIYDVDTGKSRQFKVEIIRDTDIFETLVGFAVTEAFVRVVDMLKGGTVRIEFAINGVGLKEPLKRVNYFYDAFSPVDIIWDELIPLTSLLNNNIYREVKITELSVKIDFTRNRVNASIDDAKLLTEETKKKELAKKEEEKQAGNEAEGAEGATEEQAPAEQEEPEKDEDSAPKEQIGQALQGQQQEPLAPGGGPEAYPEGAPPVPPKTVHPGETIEVEVRLQPYRQEPVIQKVYVVIPEDFPTGPTNIWVHGGGSLISVMNEFGGKGRVLLGTGRFFDVDSSIHDLDKIIEKALSTPLNNEVVITIPKPVQPAPEGKQDASASSDEKKDEEEEREFRVTLPTNWVIYNQKVLPINVQPKTQKNQQKQKNEEEEQQES